MIPVIFVYTLSDTVIGQPAGMEISAIFIAAIVATSLISRVWRGDRWVSCPES